MSDAMQTYMKTASNPSAAPTQTAGILQRKCACGGAAGLAGECEECSGKRLAVQRRVTGPETSPDTSHFLNETSGAPDQNMNAVPQAFIESRLGHNFSHVHLRSDAKGLDRLALNEGAFAAKQYVPQSDDEKAPPARKPNRVTPQTGVASFGDESILQRATDSENAEPMTGESPCEKSSLRNERELPCPGSNDRSTWLMLPCVWTMFKNTGECGIGVAHMNAAGEFPMIDFLDPGEISEVRPIAGCTSLVVTCMPDCSGRGHVKWGPPCIS